MNTQKPVELLDQIVNIIKKHHQPFGNRGALFIEDYETVAREIVKTIIDWGNLYGDQDRQMP